MYEAHFLAAGEHFCDPYTRELLKALRRQLPDSVRDHVLESAAEKRWDFSLGRDVAAFSSTALRSSGGTQPAGQLGCVG